MKILVYGFIFCCCTSIIQADVPALDTAVETGGIEVEFNTISNKGTIHVLGCELCTKTKYLFSQKPQIIKQGKIITFKAFMDDYRNAKYPTLILDNENLAVLQVVY